jgi:hypothetical protein
MKIRRWSAVAVTAALVSLSAIGAFAATGYTQSNLVSDLPGAAIGDASLVNPWGMDVKASGTLTLADKGISNANQTRALPPP